MKRNGPFAPRVLAVAVVLALGTSPPRPVSTWIVSPASAAGTTCTSPCYNGR
jgi:hypothetical protein